MVLLGVGMKKFIMFFCCLFGSLTAYETLEQEIKKKAAVFFALKTQFDVHEKWLDYALLRKQLLEKQYNCKDYDTKQNKQIKQEIIDLQSYITTEESHVFSLDDIVREREKELWSLRQKLSRYKINLKKFNKKPRLNRCEREKRNPRDSAKKQSALDWLDLAVKRGL